MPSHMSLLQIKENTFLEIPKQYLSGHKILGTGWTSKYSFADGGVENTVAWYDEVFTNGIR